MASRHLARSIAMQILYEWDFRGKDGAVLSDITERNIREFGPGLDEVDFVRALVDGSLAKREKIDAIIEKVAPEWPIEQIAMVDRNILRVGIFELLFSDYAAVPPKVAINEAIELAKSFGGETSGRFVNGVLGTIYREIGEPLKDYPKRGEKEAMAEAEKENEQKAGSPAVGKDGGAEEEKALSEKKKSKAQKTKPKSNPKPKARVKSKI